MVSWICWWWKRPERLGRPKRIVRVYCERLVDLLSVWSSTPTSERASPRPWGRLGTLSLNGLRSPPLLSVVIRSLVPVAVATHEPEVDTGSKLPSGRRWPIEPCFLVGLLSSWLVPAGQACFSSGSSERFSMKSTSGWCGICSDMVAVEICRGKEGAKPKGEASDLPFVSTLTHGHVLLIIT